LAIALVQPNGTGGSGMQSGFVASSIGIIAIVLGLNALRQRRAGLPAATLVARVGILFGGIGTAVMAYALIAVLLVPSGVFLPTLPSLAAPGASPYGLVLGGPPPSEAGEPETGAIDLAPPLPASDVGAFASAEDERMYLLQAAATAAFMLSQFRAPDSAWPTVVALGADGVTIVGDDLALAQVPAGSQLIYARSSDGMQFSLTLVGAQFASTATYDSVTGTAS
jgi:hypothetical protein